MSKANRAGTSIFYGTHSFEGQSCELSTSSLLTEKQIVSRWGLSVSNDMQKLLEHDVIVINNNRIGWTDGPFVIEQSGGARAGVLPMLCAEHMLLGRSGQ